MISDVLLALGLLLSAAFQLRYFGGLGPGELCLALWLLLMLAREVRRLGPPLTRPLRLLLGFWIAFTVAMSLGTMTGYALGDFHDPGLFLHDTLAYSLMAAVSCLCIVGPDAAGRLRRVAWLTTGFGAGWLALQVAYGWALVDPGAIDPWYWDRLRGAYENPNQLALLSAVLALTALHLAETTHGAAKKCAALLGLSIALVVGRLTKSDTFLIVVVASTVLFGGLTLRKWLLKRSPSVSLRFTAACLIITALLPIAAMAALSRDTISGKIETLAIDIAKGKAAGTEETARVRFVNWRKAFDRGVESGMLGLGPGPHIEIPDSILAGRRNATDEPRNMNHPQPGMAPNFEAHNTLLDLFTQGGLLAVASVVWLAAKAFGLTLKARLAALTTLLCALGIFSIFHLIVRHPIVWFVIASCLVASADIRRPRPAQSGS